MSDQITVWPSGLLWGAISNTEQTDTSVGYLNRNTGEVQFIYESEQAAHARGAEVFDAVLDRHEVESKPEIWIKIPKFEYHRDQEQGAEEKFINRFLESHGINAKWD